MVCCPMTTQIKGYPFEVPIQVDGVASAVLADQVKSLDWKVRRARKKGSVPADVMTTCVQRSRRCSSFRDPQRLYFGTGENNCCRFVRYRRTVATADR